MANALTYRLNKKDLAIFNTCSNINTLKGETANYACTYIHMYKLQQIMYVVHRLMPKNCGSSTGWTHQQNELHIQYLGHYAYAVMFISTRVRCPQDKHITRSGETCVFIHLISVFTHSVKQVQ